MKPVKEVEAAFSYQDPARDKRFALPTSKHSADQVDDIPTVPLETKESLSRPSTLNASSIQFASSERPATMQEPEMMTWKEVAYVFDRFMFYSFSLFIIVASAAFLTILATGGGSS